MSRLFAVIPAAGKSRRMGCPKLLLPCGSQTVIARVMKAFRHNRVKGTVVVVRQSDSELAAQVALRGGIVVQPPIDPPEMRTSVEIALTEIGERFRPIASDGWFLSPADHPLIAGSVLDRLIEEWNRDAAEILVPTFDGKRGHPILFSNWEFADAVFQLPPDVGINHLVRQNGHRVREVPVANASILFDLDTPTDYEALLAHLPEQTARDVAE